MLKLVVDNTVTETEPEPKTDSAFLTFSPAKRLRILSFKIRFLQSTISS